MFSGLLLFLCTASAAEVRTGVPVVGLPGFGHPRFQTVDTGWMASVPEGFVRVYVGVTPEDARRWVKQRKHKLARYKPEPNLSFTSRPNVDEAYGNGTDLLIFRSKNVAACSRSKVNATPWAAAILRSIGDTPSPWPKPPVLTAQGRHWVIKASEDARHIAFVGGTPDGSATLRFTKPPYRLISWDYWGRAAWTEVVPSTDDQPSAETEAPVDTEPPTETETPVESPPPTEPEPEPEPEPHTETPPPVETESAVEAESPAEAEAQSPAEAEPAVEAAPSVEDEPPAEADATPP